jgi:L-2-hydroxyglutarate oxidase
VSDSWDFVIVGGGVIGACIGTELLRRNSRFRVLLLEKEKSAGWHASGRNSGVLHSGFYYSSDSLKAKLTRDGNRALRAFALRHELEIRETGKVVVAQSEKQIPLIEELYNRGQANGVDVSIVSQSELSKLEPMARTHSVALWSPTTAVADPSVFMSAFISEFVQLGGSVEFNSEFVSADKSGIKTSRGSFSAGHVVNAAGLYADKIAKEFGFAMNHRILPFLGLYWYAPGLKGKIKRHIYPTPDPRNPFLGVHLTCSLDGSVKVGPTAIPVLSREQYSLFSGLRVAEVIEILGTLPMLATSRHHNFWSLVRDEIPKLSKTRLVNKAMKIAPSIRPGDFTVTGQAGIRAQLFDTANQKLEMDFVVQGDQRSTHVLNAVSPAWTSAITFSRYVVDEMKNRGVI